MPALDGRLHRAPLEPTFAVVSIVLHAALIYAVGHATWTAAPLPNLTTAAIVWLEPSARPPVAPPAPAEARPLELPPGDATRADQAAPERPEASASVRAEAPAEEPAASSPPAAESPAETATPQPPRVLEETPTEPTPGRDFETARQDAVALVIEQQAREREYHTFSLDDLGEEPPPAAEPGAGQDIFSDTGPTRRRPALLPPGRARTRIGRALASLCRDLGGIGVFGLFSLCAEEPERADFFGHLRPAYMDKLPVCTEQELTDAQLAAAQISDPSTIERTVVKCRLVDRDEVLVVPE